MGTEKFRFIVIWRTKVSPKSNNSFYFITANLSLRIYWKINVFNSLLLSHFQFFVTLFNQVHHSWQDWNITQEQSLWSIVLDLVANLTYLTGFDLEYKRQLIKKAGKNPTKKKTIVQPIRTLWPWKIVHYVRGCCCCWRYLLTLLICLFVYSDYVFLLFLLD